MKKLASLLLILGILLSLCACGAANQPAPTAAAETTAEPTEEPAAEPETRIVVDGLGREIEVPAKVETIVTLGNASRMATYLGLADKMITVTSGDNNDSVVMAYGYYNHDIWADLPVCSSGGYGEINPEVIIEASPDVILCTFEEDIVANIEEQLGRKVVAAPQGTLFAEGLRACAGAYLAKPAAFQIVQKPLSHLSRNVSQTLTAAPSSLADDNKPTALCAAATFRGGHGIAGVYANNAVFATVNAKDVTVGYIDAQKGVEVDKEQVLEWNPDLIVLDASNLGLVENEYAEDPAFFESLNAVKNGELYQWPNSTSNYTNVEIPLVNAYYIGSVMFPEAFADVDFETKAEEIFRFFLGHDGYLSVLNNAGMGYGSVVLGK